MSIHSVFIQWGTSNASVSIYTERLYIKPVSKEDLPKSIQVFGDPETVVLFDDGKPKSPEAVAELIDKIGIKMFSSQQPFGLFSVFTKAGKFIGHFDFLPEHQSLTSGRFEIGYILHKSEQGKGYGNEVGLAIKYYAKELRERGHFIQYLTATAHPKNTSSIRVLENMGMVFLREETRTKFNTVRKFYEMKLSEQSSQKFSKKAAL